MYLRILDKLLYQQFACTSSFKNLNTIQFKNLLKDYNSSDWKQYTKNNVSSYVKYKYISPIKHNHYSIEILSWPPNIESKIHTHASNGCLMKILDGNLTEEKYNSNLDLIAKNTFFKNDITYIDDTIAFHKIINSSNHYAYSLHIYSPNNYITKILK